MTHRLRQREVLVFHLGKLFLRILEGHLELLPLLRLRVNLIFVPVDEQHVSKSAERDFVEGGCFEGRWAAYRGEFACCFPPVRSSGGD